MTHLDACSLLEERQALCILSDPRPVTTAFSKSSDAHLAFPGLSEVIVEHRQRDVGEERRQDAALRGAHFGVPGDAVLSEDTGYSVEYVT